MLSAGVITDRVRYPYGQKPELEATEQAVKVRATDWEANYAEAQGPAELDVAASHHQGLAELEGGE